MHYTATEESDAQIGQQGMFLVDAGGHYLEGTTDTTRTYVLGEVSREQKQMFTAVCRGNLQLAFARFLYGCTGNSLDVFAELLCGRWRQITGTAPGTGSDIF